MSSSDSSSSESEDLGKYTRIKLVVVGDGAIGKTCILHTYAKGEFPEDYEPTIFENFTHHVKRGEETILLGLWDTAGQEEYDRLRNLSYNDTNVVLICFSLTAPESLESITERWAPEVKHYMEGVPSILVGTKLDLKKERNDDTVVDTKDGKKVQKKIGATEYHECSSKTREGLNELFDLAIDLGLGKPADTPESKTDDKTPLSESTKPKKQEEPTGSSGCCIVL